jgi:hypothetical protein
MLSIKIRRGVETESSDWRVISERIWAIGRLQTLKVLHCCSVIKGDNLYSLDPIPSMRALVFVVDWLCNKGWIKNWSNWKRVSRTEATGRGGDQKEAIDGCKSQQHQVFGAKSVEYNFCNYKLVRLEDIL